MLKRDDGYLRRQFIDGLRAVAEFYERTPEAYYDGARITIVMHAVGASARAAMAAAARAFGDCAKVYDDDHLTLSKLFSDRVQVDVFCSRAKLCRRIVTGSRLEPERIFPAIEEVRIPARQVDIVEWRCDPLL